MYIFSAAMEPTAMSMAHSSSLTSLNHAVAVHVDPEVRKALEIQRHKGTSGEFSSQMRR